MQTGRNWAPHDAGSRPIGRGKHAPGPRRRQALILRAPSAARACSAARRPLRGSGELAGPPRRRSFARSGSSSILSLGLIARRLCRRIQRRHVPGGRAAGLPPRARPQRRPAPRRAGRRPAPFRFHACRSGPGSVLARADLTCVCGKPLEPPMCEAGARPRLNNSSRPLTAWQQHTCLSTASWAPRKPS